MLRRERQERGCSDETRLRRDARGRSARAFICKHGRQAVCGIACALLCSQKKERKKKRLWLKLKSRCKFWPGFFFVHSTVVEQVRNLVKCQVLSPTLPQPLQSVLCPVTSLNHFPTLSRKQVSIIS